MNLSDLVIELVCADTMAAVFAVAQTLGKYSPPSTPDEHKALSIVREWISKRTAPRAFPRYPVIDAHGRLSRYHHLRAALLTDQWTTCLLNSLYGLDTAYRVNIGVSSWTGPARAISWSWQPNPVIQDFYAVRWPLTGPQRLHRVRPDVQVAWDAVLEAGAPVNGELTVGQLLQAFGLTYLLPLQWNSSPHRAVAERMALLGYVNALRDQLTPTTIALR